MSDIGNKKHFFVCDDVEDFETKDFTDTLKKTLYGNLVGTCKIREIINYPKKEIRGVLENDC